MNILDLTLESILSRLSIVKLEIMDFYFGKPFCAVMLNNDDVGAAMNYFQYDHSFVNTYKIIHRWFKKFLKHDPLLLNTVFYDKIELPPLLHLAIKNAIVNTLSVTLLSSADNTFSVFCDEERDEQFDTDLNFLSPNDRVTIIGFGGVLYTIIKKQNIRKIHICDLYYNESFWQVEYDERIKSIHKEYPGKEITISGGNDTRKQFNNSRYVFITGSALSNGTMEELLDMAGNVERVYIQGESCAIYPEVLFNHYNVDSVITTLKSRDVFWYIDNDLEYFKKKLFENHYKYILIKNNKHSMQRKGN